MRKLEGQLVIVTGGAKDIGAAVCKQFSKEGARVALWDIVDGESVAKEIRDAGGKAFYQRVDVTDQASVDEAVKRIVNLYGRIDILINNAGVIRDRSLLKMTREEWDKVMAVNVDSLYVTTSAIVPVMKKARYGRIVSASSINAYQGSFGQTNYSASKAAIVGFSHALCKELGKFNITVNVVAPGFIATEMTESIPEEVTQTAIAMTPVNRVGTPEDMAHSYLFLASKESSFITGHTLHANGGAMPC